MSNTLETYRTQIDEQGFTFEQRIDPDLPMARVDREANWSVYSGVVV